MSATVTVPINPAVLRWARESLGISEGDAAAYINRDLSVIIDWEGGVEQPPLGPMRELAELYRRPLAAFLLPSVPRNPPTPADYRVMAGGNRYELSRKTRAALNRAYDLRAAAASLERGEPPYAAAALLDDRLTAPAVAAAAVRHELGVSIDRQRHWHSTNQALNAWRRALELQGVLVFVMSLPIAEVRAFSLSGRGGPPAIVLNSGDTDTGRVFSLFHEYGHVLMGTGGICLPHEGPRRLDLAARELYCNQFSGALLVPGEAIVAMPEARALGGSTGMPSDAEIAAVAAKFRVSKQVLWYRLRDTEIITRQRFAAKWAAWGHWAPSPRRRQSGGLPPRIRVLNQRGVRFTSLVLDAHSDQVITTNEALDYLGARLTDLSDVEAEARRRAVG